MTWANAAGALASTVGDLIRWDAQFFTGKVVSRQTVTVAITPPGDRPMVAAKYAKDPNNNLAQGYGFGWVTGHVDGREVIWHNGGLPGARSMNANFSRDGLEIVALTNASNAQPEAIAMRVARAIYGPPHTSSGHQMHPSR